MTFGISRFLAAEFYRGGRVIPESIRSVLRQDSAYKRRILESDGVHMCPGLGWVCVCRPASDPFW